MSEQGRRDWDYVTFPDYQKDMDELSSTASAVVENQRREIDNLKRLLWLAVNTVGGSIRIDRYNMRLWDERYAQLVVEAHDYDMSTVVKARRITPPAPDSDDRTNDSTDETVKE